MKRVAVILLCVSLLLSVIGCGKKKETDETPVDLPVKKAESLLYYNGDVTLRFTYSDDKWVWVDGPAFPLDDSTITQIIEELPKLLAQQPIKAVDMSVYGLAEPTRYLTITGEEESGTFYFGTQTPEENWYMKLDGGKEVYLIPNEFMLLLSQSVYDMAILPTLPELTEDIVTFIGVSCGEENNTYLLQTDGVWKTNGEDVSATARKILQEVADIQITRCVDYFPASGVRELCGLADGAITVTFQYTNSVGTKSEMILTIGGETESGGSRYVNIGDSSAIYCLPSVQLTTLLSML